MIGIHLRLGHFVQFLLVEQSNQFILEGDELGILGIEVISEGFTRLS